jgi:hypothetical protein
MKRLFALIITAITPVVHGQNVNYTVTNDLNTTVAVSYWTNTASAGYQFSLSNNITPANSYTYLLSTNGASGLGIEATNSTISILVPWSDLTFGTDTLSQIFSSAMLVATPQTETVPQMQTVLKSYFVTGAIPTEADYWELIDTEFWYINQMWTNSLGLQNLFANSPLEVGVKPWRSVPAVANGWQTNIVTANILIQGGTPPFTNKISWTSSWVNGGYGYYLFPSNSTFAAGGNYSGSETIVSNAPIVDVTFWVFANLGNSGDYNTLTFTDTVTDASGQINSLHLGPTYGIHN